MLKRILSVLTARWFVTLIGAIVLSLIVWFVGPLIAIGESRPLDSEVTRLIVVLVVLVVWAIWNIVSLLRAKSANDKLVQGISQASAADTQAAELEAAKKEEVAVLRERLEDAMALLKRAKLGKGSNRQYLYQLPWYILIGPPGSGKTTALVNSGLNFPLADKFGKDAVRGVGGTRNCDWWFTDEAVLIDTAGRYTTQDSHQAVDAAAWTGFLKLLKTTRPRQPINGALIAISLSELAAMKEGERQSHARTVKQRIKELHDELGIRFPIYVLFTKVDLNAGFVEFMDDLGKDDRQQVWGFTFPLDDGKSPEGPMAGFGEEFELLQERLYQRLLERVHKEPDIDRRSLIFGFPTQMASLKQTAQEFLDQIFRPTRYEQRPLLRGVYFTSGTQEGTPIDRLMGVMASTFGLDRKRLSAFSGGGRSYFLTRLLREVVFQEAGIVSRNRRVERARVILGWASVSLATVVILGMGALWYYSYLGNKQLIADFDTSVAAYQKQLAGTGLPVNPVQDSRIDLVLPALDTLRTMPAGYEQSRQGVPWSLRFGLYQGNKLAADADALYRRALNGLFLPRLIYRLEEQLRGNITNQEFVYPALKVYLMLGVQGPLDKDLIKEWMAVDWNLQFAGATLQPMRDRLAGHLEVLLEQPLAEVKLDGNLVRNARLTLERYPDAQRAYAMIKQDLAGLPTWRVADHIGPQGSQIIVRTDGADLSEGVPGLYTYEGFHNAFVPAIENIAPEIARDRWVMGAQAQATTDEAAVARIAFDVISIYVNDYVDQWTRLLGNVGLAQPRSKEEATAMFNVLAGPTSPLKNLLSDIARETKLTAEPAAADGSAVGDAVQQVGGQQLEQLVKSKGGRLGRLLTQVAKASGSGGGGGGGEEAVPPEQRVEERFKFLHDYVEGSPAPIDEAIQAINAVYLALNNALNRLPGSGPDTALQSAVTQLKAVAGRAPASVGAQLTGAAVKVEQIDKGEYSSNLNDAFKAAVIPYCGPLLNNRYPIFADSGTDVTVDDFAKIFAPGGVLDGFFKANLMQNVDMSGIPWRAQGGLSISPGALEQFRMASRIRDALFASGSTPSARFEIVPIALDAGATQVLLEVDGQVVTYAHGPQVPVQMQWPGTGPRQARLSFQPQGPDTSIVMDGAWAFFRLIDRGVPASMDRDRFQVTFTAGSHSATFEIRAGSVFNPFTLPELHKFRCPGRL
jgi:type VI secretion system protein ImpL